MKTYKKSFRSFDNSNIIYREWLVNKAKANLVVVHGIGEHSNRYEHVVNHFTGAGLNVFTWDARGHGDSDGQRGFIESWEYFRKDIHEYFKAIKEQLGDKPVFLLGHSLGGLKTLDYLLHHGNENIQGYICSAPAIGKVGISPVLLALSKVLTNVTPRLSLDTGMDHSAISRDSRWLELTGVDKLYHSRGTPRLAMEVIKAAEWVQSNTDKLNYPILAIHGTADKICDIGGTRQFMSNTTQNDKTTLEYEGGYHELFNDIERERVLSDVENWIAARL